ncbi:hypothetical protein JWG45_21600 [Leptospira sp. 201903070]|uniref:PAS domain-containing protein n=1 Tax=Leptospira ainlahdjerensis TaxID=2810033 RepID=A0ABS2UHB2_9LEPT|nr:hypothetical protein [Leptospira ainlahdjerensis]MBM9579749.1 hypothetical protein [Leptospira ainlahdjerensis]
MDSVLYFHEDSLSLNLFDLQQGQREANMTHDACFIQNELGKAEARLRKRLRTSQRKNQDRFEIECALDSKAIIIEMNPQSWPLLRLSPSEMIGTNFENFICSGDLSKWRKIFVKILEQSAVIHTELSHGKKDEEAVVLRWSFFMDEDAIIHCKAKDETGFLKNVLKELILSKEIEIIKTLV